MKIREVDSSSPLSGLVKAGYELLAINDQPVADNLDFHFKVAEPQVRLRFRSPAGEEIDIDLEDFSPEQLGLVFEDDRIMVCRCKCIFCFVRQQPRGMRHPLYLKDEDFRLSFTHGNFITMSNLGEDELTRIVEQRMSPMYVSVHTTDDDLRRFMLGNDRLSPILPQLRRLTEGGIALHTQVVLCPGINDGEQLHKTIIDLSKLRPEVESLGVVPVGLTRYRESQHDLRCYTPAEAAAVVKIIERYQARFLKETGSRFVWAADEFYIQAGRDFPSQVSYEDMPQFENGVGMARETITAFNRRKQFLADVNSDRRVVWFTGRSATDLLDSTVGKFVRKQGRLNLKIATVDNKFWGETVTVSGLLTGQDLLAAGESVRDSLDLAVLPPNCLNDDRLFLDDMPLTEFENKLDRQVMVGSYNLADTIREAFR
jgi:putative radical SAM enzyme (TIGR03279 family)